MNVAIPRSVLVNPQSLRTELISFYSLRHQKAVRDVLTEMVYPRQLFLCFVEQRKHQEDFPSFQHSPDIQES
jgi:hypothetical protein